MMETIITFCKEYFDFISLAVGFIGVLVGVISVIQSKKSNKSNIKSEIAKKEAELKALNSIHNFIDGTTMNNTMLRRNVLDNEIAELKRQLK